MSHLMKTMNALFVCLATFVLMASSCTTAGADDTLSVSATLSSSEITMGETSTVDITVNGTRSADIISPDMEMMSLHRGGQRSRIQIINGDYSASVTTTFYIQPLQEGTFTIPPFTIKADGRTLTS